MKFTAKIAKLLGQRLTRGEFLRSLGRCLLLGILAAAAVWMIRRRHGASSASTDAASECGYDYDLPCRQRAELAGCNFERAVATRDAIRSGKS